MATDKISPENGVDNNQQNIGPNSLVKSLKRYPPAVYFIFGNEFCERFSFYGMRAVLTLFFISDRGYSDSKASLFFHLFNAICYFAPVLGSVLSDGYFGRFKVILWGSAIYVIGHALLTFGAIPSALSVSRTVLVFAGLITIGVTSGSIKPCVSAFAADQFPPNMKKQREQFFSFFYFSINAGAFLATVITPLLRGRVQCLGSQYCFPLAFGVPAAAMAAALLFFVMGWTFYKKEEHTGNIIGTVFSCILYAMKAKLRGKTQKVSHWLEYAKPKYSDALVMAIKSMLSILVMYIPIVFFWALFDQQGSTWILQARRMDGRIGKLTILPDHMNIFNPILILVLIPIFEGAIYPAVAKCAKVTALRKMSVGGLLAALSFVIAGFVQLEVNKSLVPLPHGNNISLFAFNTISEGPCAKMNILGSKNQHQFHSNINPSSIITTNSDPQCTFNFSKDINLESDRLNGKKAFVLATFLDPSTSSPYFKISSFPLEKVADGSSRIYILSSAPPKQQNASNILFVHDADTEATVEAVELDESGSNESYSQTYIDITPNLISTGHFHLVIGSGCIKKQCTKLRPIERGYQSKSGAAHILVLWTNDTDAQNRWSHSLQQIIPENKVNILWQFPQFFVISVAEILISISGLEFSYSQAAPSMRSVLQAMWLLTISFGNCIDMAISGSHLIAEPASEFFFYAALMAVVMAVFILLATRYKYVDADKWEDHDLDADTPNIELRSDNNKTNTD